MVGTSTPRLQLYKPDGNDFVDEDQDINDNYDKIDQLGKNAVGLVAAPVKRNTADAVTSGTSTMFETITGVFKAGRWYRVSMDFRWNTSLGAGTTPNAAQAIRLKAGGTVAVGDPPICSSTTANQNATSPRVHMETTFDVPSDGTYTVGFSANSGGGTNTFNILASGGTDNTGDNRCFYVEDKGEKP